MPINIIFDYLQMICILIKMDFTENVIIEQIIDNNKPGISGGDNTSTPTVTIHKPYITRKTMSRYEYAGLITQLAKYLAGIPDISKYLDEPYVNSLINPSELAFTLLENGKFDAIIDRGYELVNYSQLIVNQNWKDQLREYFKNKNIAVHNEIITQFGLDA